MENYYLIDVWNNSASSVTSIHNLFQGGQSSIVDNPNLTVNWLDGNIDADPLFIEDPDYPFVISQNSPCVDAGTLNLPEGVILPSIDILGNPRVYDGNDDGVTMIDIGCVEWDPNVPASEIVPPISELALYQNYPNPFGPSAVSRNSIATTFSFSIPKTADVELTVYNLKGQKVKSFSQNNHPVGKGYFPWNGTDEYNKNVSSGVYFYKLK